MSVVVVILILVGIVVSTTGNSTKYKVSITSVVALAPKRIGVAFQVKNLGSSSGTPVCTVTAAASSTDGGVNVRTLGAIAPDHVDYEPAASDVVTLSGDADPAVLRPGGTSIKCQ
jgi:hypothetical protein